MIPENEVLRILNHNGANRRYSKDEAKKIYNFLQLIVNELIKKDEQCKSHINNLFKNTKK